MDRLDKYGFDNPLKKIGIENIFDIEALREKCSSLIDSIKTELQNKNQTLREQWYKDLDEIGAKVYLTEDISVIIYEIIKLSNQYMMFLPKDNDDKELRSVINDLRFSLKSLEDVKKFLIEKVFITYYIDTGQSDLSRYEYTGNGKDHKGCSEFKYGAKPTDKPQKVLDITDETGDRVQVYKIGKYAFVRLPKENDSYVYNSGEYEIFTVLRYSKDGKLKTYNGVSDISFEDISKSRTFYGFVVFSKLVMENAEKNNFGYIGNVYVDENGGKRLGFGSNMESRDLVESLSYAQEYEGTFPNLPGCKTMQDFYTTMNQKVKEITDIGKKRSAPSLDDDEGK